MLDAHIPALRCRDCTQFDVAEFESRFHSTRTYYSYSSASDFFSSTILAVRDTEDAYLAKPL